VTDPVATHYARGDDLASAIGRRLTEAGKDLARLTTADLAPVDEFHIRGRDATLELSRGMGLTPESHVLDLGSGVGGPARTVAEAHGCRVTGIDLTPAFCDAAGVLTDWVGLADRVRFEVGDVTALPFADASFDAAMTLHVAMNIKAKDRLYAEARRVLRPGGVLAIYDVLQGEGGAVVYPVPWAADAAISHLATPDEMTALLEGAGFTIVECEDSTGRGEVFLGAVAERLATRGAPPVSLHALLGDDFTAMAANLARNLAERRVRALRYLCRL
jgi:ubiquinone/menaquinone biosynthesis C-methylase UbiE